MSTAVPVSEKQVAMDVIARLPEAATFDQMSEELALLAAFKRGEAAAVEGRVVPHAEVVRRSETWITK